MGKEGLDATVILDTSVDAEAEDQIHYLRVTRGGEVGRKIELGSEAVTLGRGESAGARLEDDSISKEHCSVHLKFGGAVVEDLGSTNGTFLDGDKVSGEGLLELGGTLQIGGTVLQYERMSREESQRIDKIDQELERAGNYVQSLLPEPLDAEGVSVHYRFVPSAAVGGDALGFHWLDDEHLAIYLIDASGHGTDSGLHSVTMLNMLRKESLPAVDFKNPSEVLGALNSSFQMVEHGNLYLTAWYGVYEPATKRLTYGSAGHPPAVLVTPDRVVGELSTPSTAIGLFDGGDFASDTEEIEAGSLLHIYSDGVYEVDTGTGEEWGLERLKQVLAAEYCGDGTRAEQIERKIRELLGDATFEDDFSLMVVEFR